MADTPARLDNSIRNSLYALISQFISIAAMFVCRTVFIYTLGAEYLGVSGLFSNILAILSLSELGIGTAILSTMYRPMALGDTQHVRALLVLYGKAYRVIGTIVLLSGLAVFPFLNLLIKDKPDIPNLNLIYLMYLANSVSSYFFSYKSAIIEADQKSHIIDAREMVFELVKNSVQIAVLLITRNFILYLACELVIGLAKNINLYRKADAMYPYLKDGKPAKLAPESQKQVFRNIRAMVTHQIGDVFVNSTDSIMISSFIGVFWMGLYSNYLLLSQTVHSILVQILNAITASVGNLTATEQEEKRYEVYRKVLFVNAYMFGFCAICLWLMSGPFITIWVGEEYLLSFAIVSLVCVNFLTTGMRKSTIIFRNTMGLYWNDRFNPIAEAIVNLVVSLLLVQSMGIAGVLIGKLVSTMTTCFWVEPYVLFKHGFKKPLFLFFKQYGFYFITIGVAGSLTWWVASLLSLQGLLDLMFKGLVCLVVPNLVFFAAWGRTIEYSYMKDMFLQKILKREQ